MPYIITTKTPYMWQGNGPNGNAGVTRRAVATLDEAREAVVAKVKRNPMTTTKREYVEAAKLVKAGNTLPESGGTVGPLPDGTVITVEPNAAQS